YVLVTNGGGTKFKTGEIVEVNEVLEENAASKGRKKRAAEFEPHSFYLSAWEEDQYIIAQANAELDPQGNFVWDRLTCAQSCSASTARQTISFRSRPRSSRSWRTTTPTVR